MSKDYFRRGACPIFATAFLFKFQGRMIIYENSKFTHVAVKVGKYVYDAFGQFAMNEYEEVLTNYYGAETREVGRGIENMPVPPDDDAAWDDAYEILKDFPEKYGLQLRA